MFGNAIFVCSSDAHSWNRFMVIDISGIGYLLMCLSLKVCLVLKQVLHKNLRFESWFVSLGSFLFPVPCLLFSAHCSLFTISLES